MIPLKEGAKKMWPYRCPYNRKEVEQMVKDMLDSGEERWRWRFCADYRQLNQLTIKDKSLCPLLMCLIDELYWSKIFSKIDLRIDCHQI